MESQAYQISTDGNGANKVYILIVDGVMHLDVAVVGKDAMLYAMADGVMLMCEPFPDTGELGFVPFDWAEQEVPEFKPFAAKLRGKFQSAIDREIVSSQTV